MIVSSVQFSIRPLSHRDEFWERVEKITTEAVAAKSSLVVFPEYFSLSWYLSGKSGNFRDRILEQEKAQEEFVSRMQELSDRNSISIVAGTNPHVSGDKIYNRSWILRNEEAPLFQDKVNMTRFENEEWNIQKGESRFQTFRVGDSLCGVAICYDVEFPSYTAAAAEAGVEILLVPTCTDDVHGYWRVRHCAEARTIENQCFAVTSSLVGGNEAWPEISYHFGGGLIGSPSDFGFPEGGVIAESNPNDEVCIHGALSLERLREIRRNGTVLNLRDSGNTQKIQIF